MFLIISGDLEFRGLLRIALKTIYDVFGQGGSSHRSMTFNVALLKTQSLMHLSSSLSLKKQVAIYPSPRTSNREATGDIGRLVVYSFILALAYYSESPSLLGFGACIYLRYCKRRLTKGLSP